jgi:hypothetical protein
MKSINRLALTAVATLAITAPAMAATTTHTFTGTFAGVNGGPFTNVDATFTGTADTADVQGFVRSGSYARRSRLNLMILVNSDRAVYGRT